MTDSKDTFKRLDELEARVAQLEKQFESPVAAVRAEKSKPLSAKEFLMTKSASSETQKVVVLAYFLEHIEGMASFNVADLETIFRAAKEKVPKNMNDAVNKNISRGFLDEAREKKDSKKAWYLTSTGERYVETEIVA